MYHFILICKLFVLRLVLGQGLKLSMTILSVRVGFRRAVDIDTT